MEIVSANTPWANYFPYCQAKTVTMLARHIVKLFTEHNFTHGMHCLLISESQLNKRWANIERCFIIKTNFVEHWWAAFNCGTIALMVPMMFLDRRGPPFIIPVGGIVVYIIILGFKRGYINFESDDISYCLCIGECPSNSPFLKNNGAETPKGPRPIGFKEWRDTRTFSNLKSTHCTLIILLIINLVTKKFK